MSTPELKRYVVNVKAVTITRGQVCVSARNQREAKRIAREVADDTERALLNKEEDPQPFHVFGIDLAGPKHDCNLFFDNE
jgi:hypothetical protein